MTPEAQAAVGAPSFADVATRIQAALSATATELARAGEPERVEELKAELAKPRHARPTVVLAGEAKAGKSSLVNVLVRRPDVSPVAADIATGVRIVFLHVQQPAAAVYRYGVEQPTEIALDELADWASVDGNPGNGKNVQQVAVALDAPVLADMTLIDTPGVGGLDAGHGQATLESLRHADALVFVCDAGAALTAPELKFLTAATDRIDAVILVLARSDLASHVDAVMADNARLLAANAPRFAEAPMIAVSCLEAQEALDLGDEPDAEEDLEASGIPELERTLDTVVVQRAGLLRLANALRFGESNLKAIERRWAETAAAATGDVAVGEQLAQERTRLADLQRDRAVWATTLEEELSQIGFDRANKLSIGFTEIRTRYDQLSAEANKEELAALPSQLVEEVEALTSRLAAYTSDAARAIVGRIGAEIDAESSLAATLEDLAQVTVGEDTRLAAPIGRSSTEFDRLTTMISFSSGHSIAQLLLTVPLIGLVGPALAVAGAGVGGVFAWKMGHGRKLQLLQQDFRTWQREQLGLVQNLVNNEFNRRTSKLRTELRAVANAHLQRREQEIAAAIKLNEQARSSDEAGRQRTIAETKAGLERLRLVLAQVDGVLAELRRIDA